MDENRTYGPHVRIVGTGCDVMIEIESEDDIDIAREAIDLAFKRYIRENARTVVAAPPLIKK